ncbi:hypothetical protein LJ739_16250 [Aestuariibacter halophilus]|uniref:Dienelactone hydrolase n=1 Tax=Fluctibacter halophilus TaxID=226011 RepID=A0ABS8GB37_9ALTE|nr:hypothetical protein [Aestuariibacter halophilus]MCC2617804.1 hypothetical protein [Aestuariibacter halophilus]
MKTLLFLMLMILLSYLHPVTAKSTADIAHTTADFYDTVRQRPLKVDIWYPRGTSCNGVQVCLDDSANSSLVLLSHGSMGAARDLNWLAKALAQKGYAVIGLNHYGESWVYGQNSIDRAVITDLTLRPGDAHFVLDALTRNRDVDGQPVFNRQPDTTQVSFIGHSAGGATAFLLAGARPDIAQAYRYCQQPDSRSDKSCAYIAHMPEPEDRGPMPAQTEPRVARIVALDPALGHAMTIDSLTHVKPAALIIGSVDNDFLAFDYHAARYAKHIPDDRLLALNNGEGHFVYLGECQHAHQALGVSLCQDRPDVDRTVVHQRLLGPILEHLGKDQSGSAPNAHGASQ